MIVVEWKLTTCVVARPTTAPDAKTWSIPTITHHWDGTHSISFRSARLLTALKYMQYLVTSSNGNIFHVTGPLCGEFTGTGEFPSQRPVTRSFDFFICAWIRVRSHVRFVRNPHGLLHFWLVTFQQEWSHGVHCGASGESGKKVAAAPLSKTAAAAAAAKTWFAKHPLDYMLHNRFPWKRSGRRSSMWPPYSLRRNLSAAACRPCDRSLNGWVNNREAGDLIRQRAHCGVTAVGSGFSMRFETTTILFTKKQWQFILVLG